MGKRLTTEEFIERASKIHHNKYDYSITEYINNSSKIKYICPIHGIQEQKAEDHLNGHGCKVCGLANGKGKHKLGKLTAEKFIERANKIHHNKYDYSLVIYKNLDTKVKIVCPEHGIFEQTPDLHLQGQGCSKCGGTKRLTLEEFIERANKIHNNKYDYSLVVYKNNQTKVKIICPEHGIFEQIPEAHLKLKQGCPVCGGTKRLTTEKFIEEARKVHGGKYDYSKTVYINNKTKIKIICSKHGIFEQTPIKHLSQKEGCPKCSESRGEEAIRLFCENNNIEYTAQKSFKDLKGIKTCLRFDFMINNILIEFNGKQHYEWEKMFQSTYHNFLLQKHYDWLKRKYCKDNGYKLITIPYWEYDNIEKILSKELDINQV